MADTNGSFCDRVLAAIRASGKTPIELMAETGIAQSSLYAILQGSRRLSADKMNRLAEAVGLEVTAARPPADPDQLALFPDPLDTLREQVGALIETQNKITDAIVILAATGQGRRTA